MDARSDGALRYAFLPGDDYVVAEFARYGPGDALCCHGRTLDLALLQAAARSARAAAAVHVLPWLWNGTSAPRRCGRFFRDRLSTR